MIEIGDKIQYYDEKIDQLIDDIIVKIDNNIYYLENEYEIEFKNIVKNYTKNEIYHADIKPIHKYDIGTCVYYKDRIYEIFMISNINGKLVYSVDQPNETYIDIDIDNESELIPTKNDKSKYKIGDKVQYYSQVDDKIHEGIIKEWYKNTYVLFEDNKWTFIDYLGNTTKKLRKFDIGQIVYFNNKEYTITDYFISEYEIYYVLNNDQLQSIHESMLSPTI